MSIPKQQVVRRATKILLWISLLLFLTALATCYFGIKYEVSQIPDEIRNGMEDTDWIGAEWISLGLGIMVASLVSLLAALGLVAFRRHFSAH